MPISKFKFKLPFAGRGAEIEIDGQRVTNATAVKIESGGDHKTTRITIEYIGDVEVECEGEIEECKSVVLDATGLQDKIREFEKR